MRLFIAIKLPQVLIEALTSVQAQLAKRVPSGAVKWVRPNQIHITLRFLGEVEPDNVSEIKDRLMEITTYFRPFTIRPTGLSGFPTPSAPRVIFVGLEGEINILNSLAQQIDNEVGRYGSHQEDRAFHPHLTLGRLTKSYIAHASLIGRLIREHQIPQLPSWLASEVYLIQSQLKPDGPEYTDLFCAKLAVGG